MKFIYSILLMAGMSLAVIDASASNNRKCGNENEHRIYVQHGSNERIGSGSHGINATQSWVDTIHVVFHVLWSSSQMNIPDSLIYQQLQTLNEDYTRTNADTVNTPAAFRPLAGALPVWFALAHDSAGYPTTGIVRQQTTHGPFTYPDYNQLISTVSGGSDAWDSHYLNIYCAEMPINYTGVGYMGTNNCLLHYVEIGRGKRSATHEIGHVLGLNHIWGLENPLGPYNCANDDGIFDTPIQEAPSFSCGPFPVHDVCTPGGNGIMYMNFMDFNTDLCVNMFSIGQVDEMIDMLNGPLIDLLNGASVGIDKQILSDRTHVFPNPGNGNIRITFADDQPHEVSITSVQGDQVYFNKTVTESSIDLNLNLSAGIYNCIIQSAELKIVKKVIVQ